MKFISFSLLILASVCQFRPLYAQQEREDYVASDSLYSSGKVTRMGPDLIQFQKSPNAKAVIYGPADIKEFRYGGKVFESVFANGKQKFVQRVASGKVKLYRDSKDYLLKVDSNLVSVNEENYRSVFSSSLKCEGSLLKVRYSKAALGNFVKAYNAGKCNLDGFPYRKFGAYAGYQSLQFQSSITNTMDAEDEGGVPTIGIFIDMPLYRPRSLYVTADLSWLKASPSFDARTPVSTLHLGMDMSSLNTMIDLKWAIGKQRVKPYVKMGALISYVSLPSSTGLVETSIPASGTDAVQPLTKSNSFMFGFNSGTGVEIPVQGRSNIHFELRYIKAMGGKFDFFDLDFSGISFNAGVSF